MASVLAVGRAGYFYPRSPCGERRKIRPVAPDISSISIHALLAESDHKTAELIINVRYFYPRSPCGERRQFSASWIGKKVISIHALLAESDHLLVI